jgi:hypothetical protein
MQRLPILGQLDRDLACAIALGLIEDPHVAASPEAITLLDMNMRPLGTERDWLAGDDPLDVATRDYLVARREAATASVRRPGQTGWGSASAIKARDGTAGRARAAHELGRLLLAQRGVLANAPGAALQGVTNFLQR